MSRPLLVGMWVLAGCSGTRGHVDVVARTFDNQPAAGAEVVFADLDGSSHTAELDGEGRASGDVEDGGSVWLVTFPANPQDPDIAAYTDVHGGDMLAFGPDAPRPVIATMQISGALPPGANQLVVSASCKGPLGPPGSLQLSFDDRCTTTADVVLVATMVTRAGTTVIGYIHLPEQPIQNGGTITIDPNAWRTPEQLAIHFLHASGFRSANNLVSVETPFLHLNFQRGGDLGTITAAVPFVGPLVINGWVARDVEPGSEPGQRFGVIRTAAADLSIDLDAVLAPWVMQRDYGTYVQGARPWTVEDLGGTLTADTMISEWTWVQPVANFMVNVHVRMFGPAQHGGSLDLPPLPHALAQYQPHSDYAVGKYARLMRTVGLTGASAQRAAEQVRGNGDVVLTPPPASSFAVTTSF